MNLEENARSANGSGGQQVIEDDPERTYEALKQDDELDVAQSGTVCGLRAFSFVFFKIKEYVYIFI